MLNILLPALLLTCLATIALMNYPEIFGSGKIFVIGVFAGIPIYILIWTVIRPDQFSKNSGLWIGFLFIVNISIEEFINWPTKTSSTASTLIMMFLIFISFSLISALKTFRARNIAKGIKSSFISAILGTMIALCFGFLLDYLFSGRMVYVLKNYPGYNEFRNPVAFTFFNSFSNASSHLMVVPFVSLCMGVLGGFCALFILALKNGKEKAA